MQKNYGEDNLIDTPIRSNSNSANPGAAGNLGIAEVSGSADAITQMAEAPVALSTTGPESPGFLFRGDRTSPHVHLVTTPVRIDASEFHADRVHRFIEYLQGQIAAGRTVDLTTLLDTSVVEVLTMKLKSTNKRTPDIGNWTKWTDLKEVIKLLRDAFPKSHAGALMSRRILDIPFAWEMDDPGALLSYSNEVMQQLNIQPLFSEGDKEVICVEKAIKQLANSSDKEKTVKHALRDKMLLLHKDKKVTTVKQFLEQLWEFDSFLREQQRVNMEWNLFTSRGTSSSGGRETGNNPLKNNPTNRKTKRGDSGQKPGSSNSKKAKSNEDCYGCGRDGHNGGKCRLKDHP